MGTQVTNTGQTTIQLAGPALKQVVVPPGGGYIWPERLTRGYNQVVGAIQVIAGGPVTFNVYFSPDPVAAGWTLVDSYAAPIGVRVPFVENIEDENIRLEVVDLGAGATVILNANLVPISDAPATGSAPGPVTTVDLERGGTITHRNVASGAGSTLMFGANANRIEVFGINIGPRPIHVSFGVPAVFGSGQYVAVGAPFTFDRETGLQINFVDDGVGAVRSVISATQVAKP